MRDIAFAENKKLNNSEIEQKKIKLFSKVTSLVVTLTTRCNISCIMCEEINIPWDIPKKTVDEVILLLPYLEQIIWQGGEILLLDYFKQLLEEAGGYPNLHQSIITNGLPITEELANKLVRDNVELTFSIDAVTKELYESIRKKAKFEELLNNIGLVNHIRKRDNLKSMSFRMHVVVMESNYKQLRKFIEFAKDFEFDSLHLMPIWGNLESKENIFLHKNEIALSFIKDNIGWVEEKAKEYNVNLLNSLPFSSNNIELKERSRSNNSKMLCYMPWKRLVINPAGYVCPACHCKEMVGNVLEDTLSDIWNNEKMQDYRRRILDQDYFDFCNPDCIKGIISEELRGLR